ncbi:PadR family transcriptional regulator [Massilia eurypsychrophila]|uniref:PadR family transcriptional regulator n=2 Tax=Massilia eurypsychrophila TaxID=1485217 RepID=A0A2G8TB25_9BURK|nr:PadR family transcriptional regulator [Massilia eurypsychrophila]
MIYLKKYPYCGKHGFDGGHGPHAGGRGAGRGVHEGRRRRMFNGEELSIMVLHLMEAQPRHGYDLIREFESLTAGLYAPSPGIIYPTLSLLDDAGQIEAVATQGAKRLFTITATGRARLEAHMDVVAEGLARLAALGTNGAQVDGPVARAMKNLTVVLEQILRDPKEKQAQFDIADLIDEVARKIERLP